MVRFPTDRFKDFTSNPEVLELVPERSGNEINGFGETALRKPTPIMWHNPDIIAHGDMQKWFAQQGNSHDHIQKFGKEGGTGKYTLSDLAPERIERGAVEWTREVKAAALSRDADLVGITRLKQEWVFEGFEANYEWMVILGVSMEFDNLATAPSDAAQNEIKKQYDRGTRAAYQLANWMRDLGWDAAPHGGPQSGPVVMIPGAIEAGLGELGKHGSMINRQYGSSFRLANVLTNMPLIPDAPDDLGADDFCTSCQLCSSVCPVDAIHSEKQIVRGAEKWYVDFDKCILFFVEHNGCAMCLPVCPWSRPGVAPRLADKLVKRASS